MLKTSSVFTALPVPVNKGGTGQSSLPFGYVLIGNGAAPISSVAPGTSGNILTSDGTTWNSVTPTYGTGSVTSVGTAGTVNGLTLTGGPITTTGTVTLGGTLDLSSPPDIGGTTPAAGTFTTLTANSTSQFGKGSANYGEGTGGATTKAVEFKTLGSDTNVAYAIRTKGTGAIDLAAGSSGVNISNGGTVTAITRTTTGSAYTSFPSVAITAPTTAGGVQATATVAAMVHVSSTVQSGGTGYTVSDVLTVVGGTPTASAATMTVTAVSGGVITAATPLNFGQYTVLPTNPVSVTGGTGSGATFNLFWGIGSNPSFTITNSGSGYVEQPTVSFSGGGGSGAAAYATVGSIPTLKTVGAGISFSTPGGEQIRVVDTSTTADAYIAFKGGSAASGGTYITNTGTARDLYVSTGVAKTIRFFTNGEGSAEQLRVSHTASAVNYVQVTGAATGGRVILSSQGSDANIGTNYQTKGNGQHIFYTSAGGSVAFVINGTGTANYIQTNNAAAGSAPSFQVAGTDTDIDLTLTPKGAGNVRFGTYTASALLAVAGYITIKDSGGTTRRLLVG